MGDPTPPTPIQTGLPAATDMLRLWKFCEKFIKKQEISSPETIGQCDRVIENAYDFIEGVCDIVGYDEFSDD